MAGETNTLVQSYLEISPALCKSTYNSEIVVINGDSLKTYHMGSIRGKMLQELSHWHNSKFTEDINEMVFIQLRLDQIPFILDPKV